MATHASGLAGIVYIDGTEVNFITNIEISIDRDSADEAVMGTEYRIRRVGAYGGEFSGSALVDTDSKQIFDYAVGVAATIYNLAVYPVRTAMTDYWYGDCQFSAWSASASPGDLWAGDFSGIFTDEIFSVGFAA